VSDLEIYVHRAVLELEPGVDERAPGGAVTVALCGSWDHPPPCRWPNNNEVAVEGGVARFRTVFVAAPEEADEVRARIEVALRSDARWRALEVGAEDLDAGERAIGDQMRAGKLRFA
jgi:hypothetical protein